jgi:hypothetical protein
VPQARAKNKKRGKIFFMMRFKVSKDGENLVVGDSRLAAGSLHLEIKKIFIRKLF